MRSKLGAVLAVLLALATPGPKGGSHSDVQGRIEASEYAIDAEGGAYRATNEAHRFRTRFGLRGIVLAPEGDPQDPWTWGLEWIGYGGGPDRWGVPEPALSAEGNRADLRRGSLLEWYENEPRGLKQGFLLPAPPEEWAERSGASRLQGAPGGPTGHVYVDLALTGSLSPSVSTDNRAIDFVQGARRILRYDGLVATDARGNEVPSRMEAFAHGPRRVVRLILDASSAVFPIVIDPLTTDPVWTVLGGQFTAFFGTSVATAGDVNGDGYSDLIVGAYGFSNGQTDEGRAFLYLGSASGLSTTPAWTAESDQAGAEFGRSVATAGDVNGDGYADVIVGARTYSNGEAQEGRAYLYLGSPSGLAAVPAWTAESNAGGAQFGYSVASAGDVNGDGYADVIVGSQLYTGNDGQEGRAWVFHGSATGLSAAAVWTAESDQAGSAFGWSVAGAGDVNGDGYSDVLVGAFLFDNGQVDEGRAFLYRGSASGLEAAPAWTSESNVASSWHGFAVGAAGDVNGDGYADVIVGAPRHASGPTETAEGRARVYLGSAAGLASTATWGVESNQGSTELGFSVGTAGDVNGDGYADVLVGAPLWNSPLRSNVGQALLYEGSASGLSTTAAWTVESPTAGAELGTSVATAGDVNGDGYADVVVGEPEVNGDAGRAHVYLGSAGKPAATAGWTRDGSADGAAYGYALASAGDVNGDGYADFVIGQQGRVELFLGSTVGPAMTPDWVVDEEQPISDFGGRVASAGDVNGDGYADVIVGAPRYDGGGGTDAGRAYLYLGSAAGPSTAPGWVADGETAGAHHGYAVGTAGDVNGDGYADVIVAGPSGAGGRTELYLGSPPGLATEPAWVAGGASIAGTAGDVNRDGFSDVLVGQSTGSVWLYLGTAGGLSTVPAWSQPVGGQTLESWVATAGDVNGDGYADVILGAPRYDTPTLQDAGRAMLFLGSPSGLSETPAWNVDGTQESGSFGRSVSSAGDLNGDGYADVIVGAPLYDVVLADVGAAYVYLGSAAGLSPIADWMVEGNQQFAHLGREVAGAGDVDGNGDADILVGAPSFSWFHEFAGRVFLHYGNQRRGTSLIPRPRASDDSRPIAHGGATDVPDAFRLLALGRTALGPGTVRLESEVKPLGVPFDGQGTQVGDPVLTGAAGATAEVLVQGLAPGTPHHWRVRLRHDPVTAPLAPPSGRWLTRPWVGWQETMLRTDVVGPPGPSGRVSGLTLSKAGLDVTAVWDVSCVGTNEGHAIYEGALGDFTSHVPVTCSTGGGSTWTFTPLPGNRYFLVVSTNSNWEGSYGTGSNAIERPASASACLPQREGACP